MENTELVIKNICGDIDDRIRACKSRQVAEMLKNRMCSELESVCDSEIIQNLLVRYVDKLIRSTFDEVGNNKIIMENSNETSN